MKQIRLSPRAKSDLKYIRKYYTDKAGIRVAENIIRRFYSSIELLSTHPHLGHIEPLLEDFPQCFRTLIEVPNYKIVYWCEEDIVKIATIFDTRQRPVKLYRLIDVQTNWVCEP